MTRFLYLLLLLASCQKALPPAGCLKVAFNVRPATLDPQKAGDFASSTLVSLLYEGLTRCRSDGEIELALAYSLDIDRGKTLYTFHLRNAFWSDGSPITAHDFEAAWKAALSPPQVSAPLFYPIKNAERCAKGELLPDQVGIHALNASTLQIELERPCSYFLSLTAFPSFLPAKPSLYSGPFVLTQDSWSIHLEKNLRFWNRDAIALDAIQIHIIPEEATALQLFEQGELDFIGGPLSPLPLDALEKWKEELHFLPSAATTFCCFNTQEFPFNNLSLRKAFSLAIDREQIVKNVTQTGQTAADSFLPQPFTLYQENLFDPSRAQTYFQQALQELGLSAEDLSLTLHFRSGQLERRLAQTLQRQWQELFGITVVLLQSDPKTHGERMQTRRFQLGLTSWIAQFNDPMSILERFKEGSSLKNYAGWESEKYAALLRLASLKEAEQLLFSEMPIAPIYHWRSPVLYGERLLQIGTTPCGGLLFDQFFLRKNEEF